MNRHFYTNSSENFLIKTNKVSVYTFYNITLNLNKKIKWRFDYKNQITSPRKSSSKIAHRQIWKPASLFPE